MNTIKTLNLPGCLPDRLFEAIGIARDRASHAGSTARIKKWDDTAADLRAALAAKEQQGHGRLIVASSVTDGLNIVVSVLRDGITTVIYSQRHVMNGDSIGTANLTSELVPVAAKEQRDAVAADNPDSDFRKCLRSFAMIVAEEAIKYASGQQRAVASDHPRAVVNGVMEWEIGKGLIYDLLLAAQRDIAAIPAVMAAWDADATSRLRSIVDLLGLQSCVPDGDLTGYEFAVLGFVRREIERLKSTPPAAPVADGGDADMFWDADDQEFYEGDANAFANNYAYGKMTRGDISEVTVECASRLPNRKMRIQFCDSDESDVKWKWVAASGVKP